VNRMTGRGLLFVSAVTLITGLLPTAVAEASTIVHATAGHATIATAQLVSLRPDLVLKQKLPNSTLATAQPISPTHISTDVIGSITKPHPAIFFAFALKAGKQIHLSLEPGVPATQSTELLLYDNFGNLVAIAAGNAHDGSGSVIDFTITGTGTWTAEVTGYSGAPASARIFKYDLRITPVHYATDVSGNFGANNKPGFYAISVRANNQLQLSVSAAHPATQFPELLLYDNNGNLVAIAAGNGSDGSTSVIDFTAATPGTWTVEVTGSSSAPPGNHFNYDLTVRGATGKGPVVPT